jgi:DNA polymerase-1
MQLVVDGEIELYDTMKYKRIASPEVLEKFGVAPDKVVQVQALAGDSTDNVPGVRGIGIKTAAELIGVYGDIETLIARAGEIKQPKRRETILENAENARSSLRLVTLDDKVPLKEPVSNFAVQPPNPQALIAFLKAMEFGTITRRVATHFGVEDVENIAPTPAAAMPRQETPAPQVPAEAPREDAALRKPINTADYVAVTDEKTLAHWIVRAFAAGTICIDTETTSLDPQQAGLCGVSLAVAPGEACYIPCGHRRAQALDFFAEEGADEKIAQLSEGVALAQLKPLLEDESILKVGQNLKFDAAIFLQRGIRLNPIEDTMLMSYVIAGGLHGHGMDELSTLHLNHTPIAYAEVTGKGKDKITFDCVAIPEATKYAAEDADVTLRLAMLLRPRLLAAAKVTVYETLERPLVMVLADMERAGIMIDESLLQRLSHDFARQQAGLETEIHQLAGQEFNIGSPKQLGEILFDKMGMTGGRKTKTGAWSTDSDVLEDVAAEGHPIARKVLEWRGLAKLRGTYTEALPGYINPKTGRVHTSYAMASTTTGRLASTDPNLQNIPVRTEEGRRIRQAFIAPKGSKLISADYSQIELRLLAHIADIPELKQAFADGIDIHAMTASEIFGVPVKDMPAETRRRAKAINFGIVYGISGFGLANQLGIAQSEANDYIKKYFTRFPGIRDYMEATKDMARSHGYVETLFGRRIHVREINSKIQGFRAGAERAAINAPIQGTAADVIRRAMVRLPPLLPPSVKMLLQVHDELIFEAPEKDVAAVIPVIRQVMEKAPLPAVEISVPLVVEARAADNWDAAH